MGFAVDAKETGSANSEGICAGTCPAQSPKVVIGIDAGGIYINPRAENAGVVGLIASLFIPGVGEERAATEVAGAAKGEGVIAEVFKKLLGRLGNEATRAHIDQVATEMESRGWTITGGGGRLPEEYIPGPGGARRGSSYPDITATKEGKTLRVNTVDTRADGVTPTTREANNAARIRAQTGEHVLLIPKPQ